MEAKISQIHATQDFLGSRWSDLSQSGLFKKLFDSGLCFEGFKVCLAEATF
jgi:hypothetical protein